MRIRYLNKIDTDKYGITTEVHNYFNVEDDYVCCYHNQFGILIGLTNCARDLLDYLLTRIEDSNIVYNNKCYRDMFINKVAEVNTYVRYKDATVSKAFLELTSRNVLIPMNRGQFIINPLYFSTNLSNRRKLLVKLLENKYIKDTRLTVLDNTPKTILSFNYINQLRDEKWHWENTNENTK